MRLKLIKLNFIRLRERSIESILLFGIFLNKHCKAGVSFSDQTEKYETVTLNNLGISTLDTHTHTLLELRLHS